MAFLRLVMDFAERTRPVRRRYPFVVLYRARGLGELRESLSTYYRGEALGWPSGLILAILFPQFRPALPIAAVMVCLSIAMVAAILMRRPTRILVLMIPIVTIGRTLYFATLAYAFFAMSGTLDLPILCLIVITFNISAEAMFFIRSRNLARHYAKLPTLP
jgi:hypothetical protein